MNLYGAEQQQFSGCTSTPQIDYYYDGATFSFDGQSYGGTANQKGYRTGMRVSGSNAAAWTYDTRGRVPGEQRLFYGDATAYTTAWTYNPADLPLTMTSRLGWCSRAHGWQPCN